MGLSPRPYILSLGPLVNLDLATSQNLARCSPFSTAGEGELMGCPCARFLVFNMRQKSESLKSDPALSGLVQRGKKLADLGFFCLFVSINIPVQTHCDSASSCPGAQGWLPPSIAPRIPQSAWPLGVIHWAESQRAGARPDPRRNNLCSGPKATFY